MKTYNQYCGLARALDLVGDRWTLLIVRELLTGPKRFSDLKAGLPAIATNLLTDRLRTMERGGLLERRVLAPPAGSTVYVLSDLGAELAEPVHALIRWGGHLMRERLKGQAFQPHWLGVALQALLGGLRSLPAPILLQAELPEGKVALELSATGAQFATPGSRQPDVYLRGPATTMLGLAAGELSWKEATGGGLEVNGSAAAVRALRTALTKQ